MTEENREYIKEIESGISRSNVFMYAGFVIIILGVIFLTIPEANTKVAGVAMIGIGVLLVIASISSGNKYQQMYVDSVITPMIREVFPNAEFFASRSSDEVLPNYKSYGVYRHDDSEKVSNFLETNDEHELETFSLKCSHETSDSDGNSSTVVTFEGTLLSYKVQTGIDSTVRILCSDNNGLRLFKHERTFVPKKCDLTPEKIETGNIDFDENFEVYSSGRHDAYFVLNPYVVEKLKALRGKYGSYALAVTSGRMYISFDKEDMFIKVPKGSSDFTENPFEETRKKLDEMIEVVNDIAFAISKSTEENKYIKKDGE